MKISVKVTPNARVVNIQPISDGHLKVSLRSKPIGDSANEELIEILSEYFKIAKSLIYIVSGAKSRTKVVEIDNRVS